MGTSISDRERRRRRVAWLPLGLLGVSVVALAAQTQPTFHTEANFVRVDVYATRGGVPVSDLGRDDFELFEDNAPQRIEEFRRVVLPPPTRVASVRPEPSTVSASREAAADPSSRVFVLFLDRQHVDQSASRRVQKPLIDAINRFMGPDDLIAAMTPDFAARDMTFSRSAASVESLLTRMWGGRDELAFSDPVEQSYARCYPGIPHPGSDVPPDQGIAQEMILRRREQRTLDALQDLVRNLGGLREERKTVLTISNGWRLYGPNNALARPIDGAVPSGPQIMIDPRGSRLTTTPAPNSAGPGACDMDRQALAQLDDRPRFREILDEANRANVSFYPIDPRGLVVFDEDIVPAAGVGVGSLANPTVPIDQDLRRLNERHDSLRTMAIQTDGLAVVEHSNLAAGLDRIASDVSAYYLLGYYSTGKLDGKFHAIRVRVTKPGIEIRARRGFLAATTRVTTVAPRPSTNTPPAGDSAGLAAALDGLSALARDVPLRVRAAAAYAPGGALIVSVVADAARGGGGAGDWSGGGDAEATLVDSSGAIVASGRASIDPAATSVRVAVSAANMSPGTYEVHMRAKGRGSAAASNESVPLTVLPAPSGSGSMLFRRGPSTGNKEVATADSRFRRGERLRVDVPVMNADGTPSARLLDRTGRPLPVPVACSSSVDADGTRWMTAQVALAPLAPGDYVVELLPGNDAGTRTLSAFRVVP